LSICKEIIQKMGGKVDVDSEIGVGTTFTIQMSALSKVADSESSSCEDPRDEVEESSNSESLSHFSSSDTGDDGGWAAQNF